MVVTTSGAPGRTWCLVVPVKRLAAAKTRLADEARGHRTELALAFALDTTAAALACDQVRSVVAVTNEPEAAERLQDIGAMVVADAPDAGLNPALMHGAKAALHAYPDAAVGALAADLPALRAAELAAALSQAPYAGAAFVTDVQGSGTTAVLARRRTEFSPAFGPASAQAHRNAGYHELTGAFPSLRQDVDTPEDLRRAVELGVGPRTAAVFNRLAGHRVGRVQIVHATVRRFDQQSRSGSVLLDNGVELPFDGDAFDAGGLRLVRSGQRVRLRVEDAATKPRVTFLTIATLPDPQ